MNVMRSVLIAAMVAMCGVDLVVAGWQHLCCRHRIHSLEAELSVARLARDEACAEFTVALNSLRAGALGALASRATSPQESAASARAEGEPVASFDGTATDDDGSDGGASLEY